MIVTKLFFILLKDNFLHILTNFTFGRKSFKKERHGSVHDFLKYDSDAVNVTLLGAIPWLHCCAQDFRSRPELATRTFHETLFSFLSPLG